MSNKRTTLVNMMKLVTALIILGIGASIILTLFTDLSDSPVVSLIERLYYCVTGVISISVIWGLVHNQTEMIRHQIELGNMLRKARTRNGSTLESLGSHE